MHTARYHAEQFEVEIDGAKGSISEVFPEWGQFDRFGIVVHEPFGTLGASLLVQAAIAAFYTYDQSRRADAPEYPEVYLFHVGSRHGDHSWLDFWPPRKEIEVASRPDQVLAALNDRAITRLAVPDCPPGDASALAEGPSSWAEQGSAYGRLRSCFVYSPSGRTADANLVLRISDPEITTDPLATLDPEGTVAWYRGASEQELLDVAPGPSTLGDLRRWIELVEARATEVPADERRRAEQALRKRLGNGQGFEDYRVVPIEEALVRLVPTP